MREHPLSSQEMHKLMRNELHALLRSYFDFFFQALSSNTMLQCTPTFNSFYDYHLSTTFSNGIKPGDCPDSSCNFIVFLWNHLWVCVESSLLLKKKNKKNSTTNSFSNSCQESGYWSFIHRATFWPCLTIGSNI